MAPILNAPAPEKPETAAPATNAEALSIHEVINAVPADINSVRDGVVQVMRSIFTQEHHDRIVRNGVYDLELDTSDGTESLKKIRDSINYPDALKRLLLQVHDDVLDNEDEQNVFRTKIFAVLQAPVRQNVQSPPAQPNQSSQPHSNQATASHTHNATGPAWYRGGNWYNRIMTGSAMEPKAGDSLLGMKSVKMLGNAAKWFIDRVNLRSDKYLLKRK